MFLTLTSGPARTWRQVPGLALPDGARLPHDGSMRTLVSTLVALLLTALLVPAADASPPPASVGDGQQAQCRLTRPAYPQIKPGTTSGAVRALQCLLNETQFGPVTVDGFYGPETQAAIKDFTGSFECCIDHPLLVRTWYWTILFSQSHKLRGLEVGDSGVRVKTLQRALRADGETVVVDGDFGAQTKAQVKAFQAKCDIDETGRVNGRTSFFFSQGGCNGAG
jgi:peptidoglycan hydrolase-like protein with peptidoglycan-binding domain